MEISDKFLQVGVIENRHPNIRIDLDHNVDVAIGTAIAARQRTEQGGMHYPALTQVALGPSSMASELFIEAL
jgi:hypothetical protein